MRKLILIITLTLLFVNGKNQAHNNDVQDILIIKGLILIKDTYDYVNDNKIRFEMIRRQNMLVSRDKRHLYKEYLIVEE